MIEYTSSSDRIMMGLVFFMIWGGVSGYVYIYIFVVFSLFFFPFFGPPGHMAFLDQRSDPSHICDLCHSCSNTRFFNPLCWARDWICILLLQRHCWTLCVTAVFSHFYSNFTFYILNIVLLYISCCMISSCRTLKNYIVYFLSLV